MRITGLERTIKNLTSVREDLVEKISGTEEKISKLKLEIEELEDSISDKRITIKELDNSLEALNKLNEGIIKPSKVDNRVEEA